MPVAFSTGACSASQLSSAACTFSGRRGSALAPTAVATAMATTVATMMTLMRGLPLLKALLAISQIPKLYGAPNRKFRAFFEDLICLKDNGRYAVDPAWLGKVCDG